MKRIALLILLAAGPAAGQTLDGSLREGVYIDDDGTQVIRSLAAVAARWGRWGLNARESVDLVSSASIDVRTSPLLDAVSGASAISPSMSDHRFETTLGGSWDDGRGHTLALSLVHAFEEDYRSLGGGLRATWDLAERNTTLLGGVHATTNRVGSEDDRAFDEGLTIAGASLGVAQVLGQADVGRVRYDGEVLDGYQSSPYRHVRFGDWSLAFRPGGEGLLFMDTLGPAEGLPESLPETRWRHALVVEELHSFAPSLALLLQARGAVDGWGVRSAALAGELRFDPARWQATLGLRGYLQGAADFYLPRYTGAPESYEHTTADKELGKVRSASAALSVGRDLGLHLRLDARVEVYRYLYPGDLFIDARTSLFTELGLRLEY